MSYKPTGRSAGRPVGWRKPLATDSDRKALMLAWVQLNGRMKERPSECRVFRSLAIRLVAPRIASLEDVEKLRAQLDMIGRDEERIPTPLIDGWRAHKNAYDRLRRIEGELTRHPELTAGDLLRDPKKGALFLNAHLLPPLSMTEPDLEKAVEANYWRLRRKYKRRLPEIEALCRKALRERTPLSKL